VKRNLYSNKRRIRRSENKEDKQKAVMREQEMLLEEQEH
jgi:hypothetical protein